MHETESKPQYKIGEVCELTGTQPYVLRFWESEFPTLAPEKNRSGQRVYHKRDIDLIERIKTLLYEKEYTIAGARKVLETAEDEGEIDTPDRAGAHHRAGAPAQGRRTRAGSPSGAGGRAGSSTEPGRADAREPSLPFRASPGSDAQLQAEIRNLRAKLAHAESELKAILADMDRRDER